MKRSVRRRTAWFLVLDRFRALRPSLPGKVVTPGFAGLVAGIKTAHPSSGFNGASVKLPADLYDTVKHMEARQAVLNRCLIAMEIEIRKPVAISGS